MLPANREEIGFSVAKFPETTVLVPTLIFDEFWGNQEFVASSVIQATGIVEFEDGLWIRNYLKARNGLQRVRTIPGVRPGVVCTLGFLWGQTEFQSALVCVAAWCRFRCRVRFPAAAMLGLTWPREVGTFVLFCSQTWGKITIGIPTSFLREGVHTN